MLKNVEKAIKPLLIKMILLSLQLLTILKLVIYWITFLTIFSINSIQKYQNYWQPNQKKLTFLLLWIVFIKKRGKKQEKNAFLFAGIVFFF